MDKERTETRGFTRRWFERTLWLAFALAISVLLCQFDLSYLEYLTYDLRVRLKPTSAKSGYVETVAVDSTTIKTLQRDPTAADHLKAMQNLLKAQPRAVIYVVNPEEIEGNTEDLRDFALATEKFNAFYHASNSLPIKGHESQLKLEPPLDTIAVFAGPKTMDKRIFAKDGVTRRFIFSYYGRPTLHPLLARSYNGLELEDDYRGLFEFLGTYQGFIDFRPAGTYKALSFMDLMSGSFDPERFRDKLVFIGRDTVESSQDYLLTPHSREIVAMTNLEMHANLQDTLIMNRSYIRAPFWQDVLITSLISILTLWVVLTLRPTRGLVLLVLTMSGFVLLCYLAFAAVGYWINMAHPMLAIFVCYYFFIPYRLIMENRRSWEYYQKNKLLTQVEELKSNFLRMMSHDLKTPLARIQGMTDMVLKDGQELSPAQKSALLNIHQSSEELNEFIGSILSLGRIESKEIKLHLKSKDINTLLSEVVRKCEYLARSKNIEIMTEFEPLFSIKVDEDLMRQVFTNLVENAIKYSPNESKILVSTEEIDGRIVVQVADQGIGIPKEELGSVFTKFFRSREVTSTPIKGSGLGLYLSRYFVELHKGRIDVESELQKGSTFTVELPTNLEV